MSQIVRPPSNGGGVVEETDPIYSADKDNLALTDLSNVEDSTVLDKVKNVDGTDSGLDADLVDGKQASDFANVDLSNVSDSDILTKIKNVDGDGSGLDADTLDGLQSIDFVKVVDYDDEDVLAKIKNVDGEGSGLDADTVRGYAPPASGDAADNELVLGSDSRLSNTGNGMVKLYEITLTENASSIEFDIDTSDYKIIHLYSYAATTRTSANYDTIVLEFNGNTSSIVNHRYWDRNSSGEYTGADTLTGAKFMSGANGQFGATHVVIGNYGKIVVSSFGANYYLLYMEGATTGQDAPVTHMRFYGNNGDIVAGSTFIVYGM